MFILPESGQYLAGSNSIGWWWYCFSAATGNLPIDPGDQYFALWPVIHHLLSPGLDCGGLVVLAPYFTSSPNDVILTGGGRLKFVLRASPGFAFMARISTGVGSAGERASRKILGSGISFMALVAGSTSS